MRDLTTIGLALGIQSAVLAGGIDGNASVAVGVGGVSVLLSAGAVIYELNERSDPTG